MVGVSKQAKVLGLNGITDISSMLLLERLLEELK
jgi:hypothetical protein